MAAHRAGIIGCGRRGGTEGATGGGLGHQHVAGYRAAPDCEVVAAADTDPDNLRLFCQEHNVGRAYPDHKQMLAAEDLDIVSVCLWPHLHAPVVIDAAEAGVKAIHCEKPMAPTWGEAKRMAAACRQRGVQLTFNHQRRCARSFLQAKQWLDAGAIGRLTRLEAFTYNLYDWGTHWFDSMFFFNDEQPVDWVMGQIDARGGREVFGVPVEGWGLSLLKFRNGVTGLMITDPEPKPCAVRLVGADGIIEVWPGKRVSARHRGVRTGGRWDEVVEPPRTPGHDRDTVAAVVELVDALDAGREPATAARRALQATEVIFATYESARRRGRVDLPLDVDDSPLLSMLQAGDVRIEPNP